MLELAVRLVFSLAVVVGLLLLIARVGARRFQGAAGNLVQVVHRQPLSRTSAVAVVTVGSRVLVLGTTEQQVTVLAELDPEELVTEELVTEEVVAEEQVTEEVLGDGTAPVDVARVRPRPVLPAQGGALSGSVLSPSTWKQALATLSTASGKDT